MKPRSSQPARPLSPCLVWGNSGILAAAEDSKYGRWVAVEGSSRNLWVSSKGFVLQQETRHGHWMYPRKGKITAQGYRKVKFHGKDFNVHVLVAKAFLGPRPTAEHTVDHINRVKTDNQVANLQWATRYQQAINKTKAVRRRDARAVIVWKIDTPDKKMRFDSIADAGKATGLQPSNIGKVARGEYTQTGGWKAEFDDCSNTQPAEGEIFRPIHGAMVSQHGRLQMRDGRCITPRPLAGQAYATWTNHLFHRLVALAWPDIVGKPQTSDATTVDHINRDKTDNRACNLRWATMSDQRHNQHRPSDFRDNTSMCYDAPM